MRGGCLSNDTAPLTVATENDCLLLNEKSWTSIVIKYSCQTTGRATFSGFSVLDTLVINDGYYTGVSELVLSSRF